MTTFWDNLNFIFNFKYKTYSTLDDDIKYISEYLDYILKTFESDVVELKGNKSKLIKETINIQKIIKKFCKKISCFDESIRFVKDESDKLAQSVKTQQNIEDSFLKKSEILLDKLNYKRVEIESIEKIVKETKQIFEHLGSLDDDFDPKLILKTLKNILKKTEEYNISKLKHAQKKFELSKELKDFMYGKRNPKLAHLLSLDSSVPVDSATPSKLMTPFGPVWVKRSGSDKSRMIYLIYLNQQCSRALKYDEMCKELDWKFNPNFNSKVKDLYRKRAIAGIIKPIIEYINQPLDRGQNFLGTEANSSSPEYLFSLVKHNYPISKYLTISQKEAAAFLCGVLLLSESHEFRNPTGGKFERKAMKNVLELAENGCVNPFSKVFSNVKGRYIPAHDKGEETSDVFPGGQRQASILINLHKIFFRYLCFNLEFKNRDKNCATFKTDYIEKVTSELSDISDNWDTRGKMLLSGQISTKFKKNQQYINNKLIYDEFVKGFKFLINFQNAKADDTFDIDDLPDLPEDSLLSKIKKLTKTKNIVRINKLLNNSL